MVPVVDPIPLFPVESSNIAEIGYAPERQTLAVKFKSGSLFHYRDVPDVVYVRFAASESKGKHFHEHIRGQFQSEAVKEVRQATCPACGDHGIHGCVCDCCGCANYSEAFQ